MEKILNEYKGNILPEEIVKKIINSKEVILTAHINPDGDALGSMLSLMLMIDEYNKKHIKRLSDLITVRAVIDDNLPEYANKFEESILIENYENFSLHGEADLFISVDCATEERCGRVAELKKKCRESVNIDHHISNTEHADYNYIESISSTSELLYKFIPLFKIEITKKIAEFIYLGIINDTGNFRNDNITAETFETCSRLIEAGVNNSKISDIIFSINEKKAALFGEVYKDKKIYEKYNFIYYYLTQDKMNNLGIKKYDTDGIAELLLRIENMRISLFIREEDGGILKGSLRCNEKYNVNDIASEFGGGGHIKAAGFKTKFPFEEIMKRIIHKLEQQSK